MNVYGDERLCILLTVIECVRFERFRGVEILLISIKR